MRIVNPRYNFFRRDYWLGQVDSRPLSAFRIVFGLILLKDALYHIPLASFFYSDEGILPRSALLELARPHRFPSIMDAMPYTWMAALLFMVWAGIVVALILGYRTKLMSILSFLILISVQERNVYVLTGADTIMRNLSFWMLFIPLGQHYSVDAWRLRRAGYEPRGTTFAFPVRVIQLQVGLVYIFTGWLKALGPAWQDGSALGYVLQLETMLLPPGELFRDFAPLWAVELMTYATVVIEVAFIFLIFSPVFQPYLRLIGLAAMASIHLGIGLMMSIPDFSIIMISSYLLFFEPQWIEALAGWSRRRLKRPPPAEPASLVPEPPATGLLRRAPLSLRRGVVVVVLGVLLLGVVWWNVDYMGAFREPIVPMPDDLRDPWWYTGLWQYWDLFSPVPLLADGWITIPGKFEDGTTLELRTGGPDDGTMLRETFGPWVRNEKLEENLNHRRYEPILSEWGQYFCRQYNIIEARPEGQRLATLEIHCL